MLILAVQIFLFNAALFALLAVLAVVAAIAVIYWVNTANKMNPNAQGMCTIPGQTAPVHCSYSECASQGGTNFAPDDGSNHVNPQTGQVTTQTSGGQGGGL